MVWRVVAIEESMDDESISRQLHSLRTALRRLREIRGLANCQQASDRAMSVVPKEYRGKVRYGNVYQWERWDRWPRLDGLVVYLTALGYDLRDLRLAMRDLEIDTEISATTAAHLESGSLPPSSRVASSISRQLGSMSLAIWWLREIQGFRTAGQAVRQAHAEVPEAYEKKIAYPVIYRWERGVVPQLDGLLLYLSGLGYDLADLQAGMDAMSSRKRSSAALSSTAMESTLEKAGCGVEKASAVRDMLLAHARARA